MPKLLSLLLLHGLFKVFFSVGIVVFVIVYIQVVVVLIIIIIFFFVVLTTHIHMQSSNKYAYLL